MKPIKKYLLQLDVFGSYANIQINQNDTHKTYCGSLITLSIMVLVFYSSISLVRDALEGKNPQVLENIVYNYNPSVYIYYLSLIIYRNIHSREIVSFYQSF